MSYLNNLLNVLAWLIVIAFVGGFLTFGVINAGLWTVVGLLCCMAICVWALIRVVEKTVAWWDSHN